MRSGRLRNQIELQEKSSSTRDTFGQPIATWRTFATVWGEIVPSEGSEAIENGQFVIHRPQQIRIRYNERVSTLNRVRLNSRYFDILSVNDTDERHREMILSCKERLSQ